jgi:hypothetical protein
MKTLARSTLPITESSKSLTPGSQAAHMKNVLALQRAKTMLDFWRTGSANNTDTYLTAVAAILARYPDQVIYSVTSPTDGLPVQLTWMPSLKEVKDACEKEMEPIYKREREAKIVAETLADREVDKSGRPTKEDLKAKYGENWGLTSLDEPVRKPQPAPSKEDLAAHYREYGLGFRPKEQLE